MNICKRWDGGQHAAPPSQHTAQVGEGKHGHEVASSGRNGSIGGKYQISRHTIFSWTIRKYESVAFGISFRSAGLHPATAVIDARQYETLVSRQETICGFRPAKPERKTITSPDVLGGQQMDVRVR